MISLLLPVIYIAFISLGLPDALLGSAWPIMGPELKVPLSYAGIVSMIIAGCTIVSSLNSDCLNRRFGTGLVTTISVATTAVALLGFSFSSNFVAICIWAIPYGLGAGAVDSALNNFVALHYKSRHMSWLHCFWGVGASIGPYVMGFFLTKAVGWRGGYRAISIIQIALTFVLIATLPLWKKQVDATKKFYSDSGEEVIPVKHTLSSIFKIRGVPLILFSFFGYCAMESSTGLWASSYLVKYRGIEPEIAARFSSLFYLGITGGRFLNGFVANRAGDRNMIRVGIFTAIVGIVMVALPLKIDFIALAGLIIIGLGCAPIYPSIIHATPSNFGRENSQAIVGVQMASAYTGSTFMPPIFGVIASHTGLGLYPLFLMCFAVIILLGTESLNKMKKKR